jgi:PKD repeat protein
MKSLLTKFLLVSSLFVSCLVAEAADPTIQASNMSIGTRTDDALTVSWTRGNGNYVLVVCKPTANSYSYPVDATVTAYSSSSTYGSGAHLGNSNYVVYRGTGSSVTITNLSPSTQYTIIAYEYNITPILFTDYYYYLTTVTSSNTESGYTLCTPTTSNVTNYSASSISYTTATVNFTKVTGYNTFITCNDMSSNPSYAAPVDGNSYTASATYGNGTSMSTDNYVVYGSSGSSVAISNLMPARTYRVRMWPYCGSSTGDTWNYGSYQFFDFTTLNNAPTLNSLSNVSVCQNSSWTAVSLSNITDGSTLETQNLTVTATSSNTTLIPNGNISISYSSPSTTGTLYFYPTSGQYGTSTITVTVNDGFTATNTITRTFTVTVLPFPSAAGAVSGTTTVCKNGSNYVYSVSSILNATGYTWTFPSGTVIVSGSNTNTITVNFPPAVTASTAVISVYGTNANGCGNGTASTKNINLDAAPTTASAGADQIICNGTTVLQGNTPSVGTGLWTVISGSASFNNSAQSNTNVTGIASGQTVNLQWAVSNGVCPTSTDQVLVTYNPAALQCLIYADFLASNTTPCTGSTVNFTDNSVGATGWSWNFGPNASPSTSTLQNPSVTFTSAGQQTISLTVTGPNGSDNETKTNYITVQTTPGAASAISGLTTVCAGTTQVNYSINAVANATNYNWSLPSGATINSGTGTEAITVNYANNATSGTISVQGTNICGTGTGSNLLVTVNPLPSSAAAIVGDDDVCQGETGVVYTIPALTNTTTYNWTLPVGASIVSGANTNSITVDYATNAFTGDIVVYGANACGDGASSTLNVTVNPLPADAGVISGTTNLTQCPASTGIAFSVPTINNASGYTWDLPAGAVITSGNNTENIVVDFLYGTVDYTISVSGTNACGNGISNTLNLVFDDVLTQDICLVTVDETSTHNIVTWEKTQNDLIDSFRVYREVAGFGYQQIASIPFDSLSSYTDVSAGVDPNVTQYRYKVSVIDTCGNEGPLSGYHQTIYVFPPQVNGNDIILDWDPYDGFAMPNFYYRILRDTAGNGNWVAIDSVPEFTTVYTDLNAMNEGSYLEYYIEVFVPDACLATRAISQNTARSNRTQGIAGFSNGVDEFVSGAAVSVIPNPAKDWVNISLTGPAEMFTVDVLDINGRVIGTYTFNANSGNLDISGLSDGVYMLRVQRDGMFTVKRLVKQ